MYFQYLSLYFFAHIYTHTHKRPLNLSVECSSMAWDIRGSIPGGVIPKTQKWFLIPCLTLSIIRLVSRVKWINSGKGVEHSFITRYSSYWKGSLRVALDDGRLRYIYIYIYIYIYTKLYIYFMLRFGLFSLYNSMGHWMPKQSQ